MPTPQEITPDLLAWQKAKAALEEATAKEAELRRAIFAKAFPDAKDGTNNFPLGNGYVLKGVKKLNYNLKNTKEGEETVKALDAIEAVGNFGAFIADELVSWKPSLSLTAYKKLDPTNSAEHKKIKDLIDSVLTTSDGMPTLEIELPKKK